MVTHRGMLSCYCLGQSKVVTPYMVFHSLRQSPSCRLPKSLHLEMQRTDMQMSRTICHSIPLHGYTVHIMTFWYNQEFEIHSDSHNIVSLHPVASTLVCLSAGAESTGILGEIGGLMLLQLNLLVRKELWASTSNHKIQQWPS